MCKVKYAGLAFAFMADASLRRSKKADARLMRGIFCLAFAKRNGKKAAQITLQVKSHAR